MKSLSVIILSYNSRQVTSDCLTHLRAAFKRYPLDYEVIVVDNNSHDESVEMLQKTAQSWPELRLSLQTQNLGFTKGNNIGFFLSKGKYILLLNSDVIVDAINFNDLISFLEKEQKAAALTIKLLQSKDQIDPASHRGFPTVWRSLAYFLKLERIFHAAPLLNKIFGGYHLIDRDLTTIHEIDSPTGAFYFIKRDIFHKLGGFDEDFFMYGEDLDLSFRIKKLGYRIYYYPLFTARHLKYQSGLQQENKQINKKTRFYFYDAWRIFYQKHYAGKNNWLINQLVYFFINMKTKKL